MASVVNKNIWIRFVDVSEEPNQVLLPIKGYEKEPLMSIEEAVKPFYKLFDDFDTMIDIAKQNSKYPLNNLTSDESAAIHLYTIHWEEPHINLHTKLNKVLRSERRDTWKVWFPYLKLILTGLYKLPSLNGTIWRGAYGNLSDQYQDTHIWWGFSSCTRSKEAIDELLDKSKIRTLFCIECIDAKAIQDHSFAKKENEILLLPGTYLRVLDKSNPSTDLYIVYLQEEHPPRHYLEPPFTVEPQKLSSSDSDSDSKTEDQSQNSIANSLKRKSEKEHFVCSNQNCNNRCPNPDDCSDSWCDGGYTTNCDDYRDCEHCGSIRYCLRCLKCRKMYCYDCSFEPL